MILLSKLMQLPQNQNLCIINLAIRTQVQSKRNQSYGSLQGQLLVIKFYFCNFIIIKIAKMNQTQAQTQQLQTLEHQQSTKIMEQYAYFIQGYQLPPDEQVIRNRLLTHIPTLRTKSYRESLLKIVSSFSELDNFSDNLQKKVDNLLLAQEAAFVESYKHHMSKIKHEFDQLNKQIYELQQKIRYYENEGQMSSLVKKVFQLEQESSKLFKMIAGKDKKIRDQQLTITVLQREMKTMKDTVKSTVRQKSEILLKQNGLNTTEQETKLKLEDITVFATQLSKKGSITTKHQIPKVREFQSFTNTIQKPISKSLTVDIKYQPAKLKQEELSRSKRLSGHDQQIKRDISQLKQVNKRLVRENVRLVQQQNQLQEFFIKCVEELKKQIRIRKKMEMCTLQDFRKEDKLLLLIKVLSNDDILSFLHQRIFNKNSINNENKRHQQREGEEYLKGKQKLPRIKFNLSYQKK